MPPQFAGGLIGGGGDLGSASGHITLDVSSLQAAEQVSRSVGRSIEQNLNGIGKSSDAAVAGIGAIGREITAVRGAATKVRLNTLGAEVAAGNKDVQQAALEYRRFRDELGLVEQQAKQTAIQGRTLGGVLSQGLSGVQNVLQSFRGELIALGAGAGLTLGFGLKAAQDIRAARIRLSQFVETEEQANDLMNMLADSAGEFGLEINGVLSLAGTLLPLLEGNVEATNQWVLRAARLRTVLPTAQQGAELRAISEYLSGQTVSLQRLFNIPPSIIQDAKAQFQDAGDQIDYILNRMGATEEAARDMADPLVSVKNELKLIASTGFTPILERLREILPEFRSWLQNLRETRPEILEIGGAFVTAVAIAAPMLLFLNTVLATLQKIQALGALGILGKAGLIGLAGVGGSAAAVGGLQGLGRANNDERLENITAREMYATAFKAVVDMFFIFTQTMAPIFQAVENGVLTFLEAITAGYMGLGKLYSQIGNLLPDELGGGRFRSAGGAIEKAGAETMAFIESVRAGQESLDEFADRVTEDRDKVSDFIDRLFGIVKRDRPGGQKAGAVGVGTAGTSGLTEAQIAQAEAWEQYQEAIADIESRMQERRLQITEQYEQQRTQIIARYEQTIAREAEDFARQQARAEQNLQDDIADIQQDAAEREQEWWQDLAETIGELRIDSADRIAEIEEQANRDRERMEREHRLNLLQAASRLDAAAVANEQMRFRNQSTNFEQDLQIRIQREQENLQERIAQEQEAHQERLEEARAADAERIEDLREAHAERIALEDEDREIRLRRMKEDHIQQLAELKRSHFDRLNELKKQAYTELTNLKNEFIKRTLELTNFYNQWLTTQIDEQAQSLLEWQEFWKEWYTIQQEAEAGAGGGGRSGRGTSSVPPTGTNSGVPSQNGPAVQGGIPNAFTPTELWGATGNGMTHQTTTTNGGNSVNANITIVANPNQSAYDIGKVVKREMIQLIRSVA